MKPNLTKKDSPGRDDRLDKLWRCNAPKRLQPDKMLMTFSTSNCLALQWILLSDSANDRPRTFSSPDKQIHILTMNIIDSDTDQGPDGAVEGNLQSRH